MAATGIYHEGVIETAGPVFFVGRQNIGFRSADWDDIWHQRDDFFYFVAIPGSRPLRAAFWNFGPRCFGLPLWGAGQSATSQVTGWDGHYPSSGATKDRRSVTLGKKRVTDAISKRACVCEACHRRRFRAIQQRHFWACQRRRFSACHRRRLSACHRRRFWPCQRRRIWARQRRRRGQGFSKEPLAAAPEEIGE